MIFKQAFVSGSAGVFLCKLQINPIPDMDACALCPKHLSSSTEVQLPLLHAVYLKLSPTGNVMLS
jgi:hypothetical protein